MIDDDLWGDPVRFVIPGEPVQWMRPKQVGRRRVHHPAYTAWKQKVALLAPRTRCPDGLLSVSLRVVVKRPRDRPKPPTVSTETPPEVWAMDEPPHMGRADVDNFAKGVLDGLAPWLGDDRRVTDLRVTKVCGDKPRVEVEVRGLHSPA